MVTDHDFTRCEFDWLAHDEAGHVGIMSTAGVGPVPSASLEDAGSLEDLLEQIDLLPKICEAWAPIEVEHYIGNLLDIAARGFYAFDWCRETGKYRLYAIPLKPLNLYELRHPLRDLAKRVHMRIIFKKGFEFDETIDVSGSL